MITVETIALIVSLGLCAINVLAFAFSRLGDHGKREHWQGQVTVQLANISEDIKDVKADQKTFNKELAQTREIAYKAKSTADKAHERLDKLNAPSAYGSNE